MSDSQYLFEYNCQKMELLKLVLIIGFATAAFPGQSSGYDRNELCRIGEEVCGRVCYDPTTRTCFQNATLGFSTLCRISESICASSRYHVSCYDQKVEVCHLPPDDRPSLGAMACTKGQKICNGDTSRTCYNPEHSECLSFKSTWSSNEFSMVCMKGQKLCDTECYFPESRKCVNSTDY